MKPKHILLIAGGAALAYGIYGAYQMSTNGQNISQTQQTTYSLIGLTGLIVVASVLFHPHYEKLTEGKH